MAAVKVDRVSGEGPALNLKASVVGVGAPTPPMAIEVLRWSTDVERAPLLAALLPVPSPAPGVPVAPAGRGGRGGRGGRAAAPPPGPLERLTTAIKAAPTVGFIWSDGPTGYSIKYAWHAATGASDRIVLLTDRRLGANTTSWPTVSRAGVNAEFTLLEMRIGSNGVGEAKSSLAAPVVIDPAANTLAIEKYMEAPVLLKVTR